MNTPLWIGLGSLLVVVAGFFIFYTPPKTRARYRKFEEEEKERKKTEAARMARQMENFKKQRLVVYIRRKDGGKSSFEAMLISAFLEMGVTVELIKEKDGRAIADGEMETLKNGVLAVIGTAWHSPTERCYCDYRLLSKYDNEATIIAAGNQESMDDECLAGFIIDDLVSKTGFVET